MYQPKKDKVLIGLIIVMFFLGGIALGLYLQKYDNIYEENKTEVENKSDIQEEEKVPENNDTTNIKSEEEKTPVKEVTKPTVQTPIKEELPIQQETPISYSSKDEVVIQSLNETLSAIESSNTSQSFTKSAKATFVNIVDFLFYDGSIKGVTFKELTTAGKEKVLELASKIDKAIEKKIPGYKETISASASSALKKSSELITRGANNVNDFLENHLSTEDYNSIIDAKEELKTYTKNATSFIKDVGSNLFSSTKDKLNNWYQEWKNK